MRFGVNWRDVEREGRMTDLHLYSYQACPFAQRTRMTLAEKQLDFDATEIDLGQKPDWFLKVSPYGKVPCLDHKGHVLYESGIINEYLDEVFPETRLMPADPYLKAQARIWMHYCDNYYSPASWRVTTTHDDPAKQKQEIEKLYDCFAFMEEGMRKLSDGPFWLGDQVSLVDIHYSPFLERFAAYTELWDVAIPQTCTRLTAWGKAMTGTKSYQATARSVGEHVEGVKRRVGMSA